MGCLGRMAERRRGFLAGTRRVGLRVGVEGWDGGWEAQVAEAVYRDKGV